MAQPSKLIIGLGNPGPEYVLTRHNIGFMAVDIIAKIYSAMPWSNKFKAHVAALRLKSHELLLLKPQTFMNLSGQSVGEVLRFYKLAPKDVIVFHDEIDLSAGKIRVKKGGSPAGHNGLKSLDAHIGQDYWRVRLGVGHPGGRADVSHFVLGEFSKSDQEWLEPLLLSVGKNFPLMLGEDQSAFASHVSHEMAPLLNKKLPDSASVKN